MPFDQNCFSARAVAEPVGLTRAAPFRDFSIRFPLSGWK